MGGLDSLTKHKVVALLKKNVKTGCGLIVQSKTWTNICGLTGEVMVNSLHKTRCVLHSLKSIGVTDSVLSKNVSCARQQLVRVY